MPPRPAPPPFPLDSHGLTSVGLLHGSSCFLYMYMHVHNTEKRCGPAFSYTKADTRLLEFGVDLHGGQRQIVQCDPVPDGIYVFVSPQFLRKCEFLVQHPESIPHARIGDLVQLVITFVFAVFEKRSRRVSDKTGSGPDRKLRPFRTIVSMNGASTEKVASLPLTSLRTSGLYGWMLPSLVATM